VVEGSSFGTEVLNVWFLEGNTVLLHVTGIYLDVYLPSNNHSVFAKLYMNPILTFIVTHFEAIDF